MVSSDTLQECVFFFLCVKGTTISFSYQAHQLIWTEVNERSENALVHGIFQNKNILLLFFNPFPHKHRFNVHHRPCENVKNIVALSMSKQCNPNHTKMSEAYKQ